MSNKQLDARDNVSSNQSKTAITGTNDNPRDKRGLDVNLINQPVDVNIVDRSAGEDILERQEALATVRDIETNVLQYVVPAGKRLFLNRIDCTGCNRAQFRLYIDNTIKEDKNTWWGDFNASFIMDGFLVPATSIVKITSEHFSPYGPGDASATLKGVLQDE